MAVFAPRRWLRTFVRDSAIYHRLRGSSVYDVYWRAVDCSIVERRDRQVDFYRRVLVGMQPGDLVSDVGANHGAKVDIFLRLGARVVAVEPDKKNQAILRKTFLALRLMPKPVTIVAKAVGSANGV